MTQPIPAREPVSARNIHRDLTELLNEPRRWIKGAPARQGRTGKAVNPRSAQGTCFCLTGALAHVLWRRGLIPGEIPSSELVPWPTAASDVEHALYHALKDFQGKQPESLLGGTLLTMIAFNDHPTTSHADLLAVLDKAGQFLEEAV